NGRAFEYLLIKMAASPLAEVRELGFQLSRELGVVIPAFTKRAGSERGRDHSSYLRQREQAVESWAARVGASAAASPPVSIVDYEPEAETKVLASLLYPHTNTALGDVRRYVDGLDVEQRLELLHAHLDKRSTRHRRPG